VNSQIKDRAQATISEALRRCKTKEESRVMIMALATAAMVRMLESEGKEKAAMAAYALGDHFVDPDKKLP